MIGPLPYGRALACGILAALWGLGCQTTSFQEFDQGLKASDLRHLYEPLAATESGLLEQIALPDTEAAVFALSPLGARVYADPLPQEQYWEENKAVFIKVQASPADEKKTWAYFNGHKLRIEPLVRPFPADGDLVEHGDAGFSIYRSVAVRKGGVPSTGDLDIFRFDFTFTDDGAIEADGHQRITTEKGADIQAALVAGQVVYAHQTQDEPTRLMVADPQGGGTRALFSNQEFDSLFLSLLPDGRIVFSSNALGYYALFQLDDAAAYVEALPPVGEDDEDPAPPPAFIDAARPFEYPFPKPERSTTLFLGSVAEDGVLKPVLFTLPERLDLVTIAHLVTTHNPAVNEQRARYAGALVDAARFRLNNWPRLDLGLSYDHAIELFDNMPAIFTGDTVTKQIFRVMVGLSQPLLEFKRNKSFTKAALAEAELSRNLLDFQIDARVTEATELYFEALYLSRRIQIETEQIAVTERRAAYYRTLRERHEALRLQLMAAEQVLDGLHSERCFHQDRLRFLKSRLNEVMGLPLDTPIALVEERFNYEKYPLPPLEKAIHLTQLNHSAVQAAKNALESAYYHQAAGPDLRPRASLSGFYEHRNREFQRSGLTPAQAAGPESVGDEIVSFALTGQIPLASIKAKRLHHQMWSDLIDGLQLAHDAALRDAKTGIEEAYMDFSAAKRDLIAKTATQAYFLEKLRVARLYIQYGPPRDGVTVLRPPDEPGAIEETLTGGLLAPLTAQFEYLRALDKANRAEMDLGVRFAHVWREMGLIERLTEEGTAYRRVQHLRTRPAVWLWHTRDHIDTDDALDDLVDGLGERRVRRLYAYLYSDARILDQRHTRERFTLLVEQCQRRDIEVWALLGEPEWIDQDSTETVVNAIRKIKAFNAAFTDFEPKIAGVKLDLEPHSIKGWNGDRRAVLERNYRNLLEAARKELDGALPLWADLPTTYLRDENADLLAGLSRVLDGATLMDYFGAEEAILESAEAWLAAFDKPLEIGLDFSTTAPAGTTLAGWPADRVTVLVEDLTADYGEHPHYAGTAFHDYEALTQGTTRE